MPPHAEAGIHPTPALATPFSDLQAYRPTDA
jgi:hypothetical protein